MVIALPKMEGWLITQGSKMEGMELGEEALAFMLRGMLALSTW